VSEAQAVLVVRPVPEAWVAQVVLAALVVRSCRDVLAALLSIG